LNLAVDLFRNNDGSIAILAKSHPARADFRGAFAKTSFSRGTRVLDDTDVRGALCIFADDLNHRYSDFNGLGFDELVLY